MEKKSEGSDISNFYYQKMVTAGETIEMYTYETPVVTNRSSRMNYIKPVGRSNQASEQNKTRNREITLKRSKKNVRQLINANHNKWNDQAGKKCLSVSLTLTYAKNMDDIHIGNNDFQKFIKRLNYYLHKGKRNILKYIAVPEFQDRGALHYHSIFFNLPFVPIEEMKKIWKHGHVSMEIVHNKDRIVTYMTKQMKLENDDERLKGTKCYLASQGLHKPRVSTNKREIESAKSALSNNKIFEIEFESKQYGNIKYEKFDRK